MLPSGGDRKSRVRAADRAVRCGVTSRVGAFRLLAAALVPLLLLAALETSLRLAGVGYPTTFFLAREVQGEPCQVENPKFGWRFFGPRRARTPLPLVVRDAKSAGTCRIFLLGESAAYGDPQPAFGLARHLEALLRARFPGARFEVVNAAMTAINSHVILPIARDCARRAGDIWVIYMGNNEVVGPFGAGTVFGPQTPGLGRIRARLALKATRTGQLLDSLRARLRTDPESTHEWGGMPMFLEHQVGANDARLQTVYAHFARNLEDILDAGRRSGARVVVSTVAVNLRDCAPFASCNRPDLVGAAREEWNRLFRAGIAAQENGQAAIALEHFRGAAARDDRFAELHFRWGQCALALDDTNVAKEHFVRARDEDALRFRCDSRLNEIVRMAARGREPEGVFLADGDAALARESPGGLIGAELLYEHVHLRFRGNYLLARCLAEQAARALPATIQAAPATDWLDLDGCARALGWTDWTRHEGATQMLARLADPPFPAQANHREQRQQVLAELADSRVGLQPEALDATASAYRELLDRTPEDAWWWELLARLEMRRNQPDAAAAAWRRLLTLLPQHVEARGQLGRSLALLGRDEEAVAEFAALLQEDPNSIVAREGLAFVYTRRKDYAAAMTQHETLLRRRPLYSPSHLGLGALLTALGRAAEGQRHYRLAVAHPLNTAPALRAVGLVCLEQGWMAEAVTNFTRSLLLDPAQGTTHVRLGQAWAALGRNAEAAAAYTEALRWEPTLAEAHFRLGFELGRRGADAEALARFAEAVRLDPEMLQARLNLGIATYRQGRTAEARTQFEEVLRRDPTNQVARQYLARLVATPSPPGDP